MTLEDILFDIALEIELFFKVDLDPYIVLQWILKKARPVLDRMLVTIGSKAFKPIKKAYNFMVQALVKVQVKHERLFRQLVTDMVHDNIMNGEWLT